MMLRQHAYCIAGPSESGRRGSLPQILADQLPFSNGRSVNAFPPVCRPFSGPTQKKPTPTFRCLCDSMNGFVLHIFKENFSKQLNNVVHKICIPKKETVHEIFKSLLYLSTTLSKLLVIYHCIAINYKVPKYGLNCRISQQYFYEKQHD